MTCDNIRSNIKPFLEDMLSENEFKEFTSHLESCSSCTKYVNSLDSISNQVRKLGDIEVPGDLCSSIIFKFHHPDKPAQAHRSTFKQKVIFGLIVLFFVPIIHFFIVSSFKTSDTPTQETTAPLPKTSGEKKYQAVHPDFFKSTTPMLLSEEKVVMTTPTHTYRKSCPAPDNSPVHWHLHSCDEIMVEKSLNLVKDLGITPVYYASDILIFDATSKDAKTLSEKLQLVSFLKNYGGKISLSKKEKTRIFLYFERKNAGTAFKKFINEERTQKEAQKTRNLLVSQKQKTFTFFFHWHITVSATKKPDIFHLVKNYAVSTDYISNSCVVFLVPIKEIKNLIGSLKLINETLIKDHSSANYKIFEQSDANARVSFYISEG
ncbi:MAG: zf-HC2 domain-containing protein [Candidatus Omnitrophica bacterium]|nr:zf-HC2 domain-containing protein [Candidatus Omnitrophota bacterium]